MQQKYLILTLNLIRFLALKLIKQDQMFLIQVENVILSSNNRTQLVLRTI